MTKFISLYQLQCVTNGEDVKEGDNLMARSEGKRPLLLPSCIVFATFHSHHSSCSNGCMLMEVHKTAYVSFCGLL